MKNKLFHFVIFIVFFYCCETLLPLESNAFGAKPLNICSFNISFLGSAKEKDNEILSKVLKDYDIVVVQGLVAPPVDGNYPNKKHFSANPEATKFFQCMKQKGFSYVLSEEDTGINNRVYMSEWCIAFYKPTVVKKASGLPCGFISNGCLNNDEYERVPYAFPFRTINSYLDFVLISVHLRPGDSEADRAKRLQELDSVVKWIEWVNKDGLTDKENDFIVVGNTNIQDQEELMSATPRGYVSLNSKCCSTATNPKSSKPYDHIMYNPIYTTEIDSQKGMLIIDLVKAVKPYWNSTKSFPGDPYVHDQFRQYYSDHNPVVFKMNIPEKDDD